MFGTCKKILLAQNTKNYCTFYSKICIYCVKNMGLGSGIRKKPIPDPQSRVKKAPDPASGSATLNNWLIYALSSIVTYNKVINPCTVEGPPGILEEAEPVVLQRSLNDLHRAARRSFQQLQPNYTKSNNHKINKVRKLIRKSKVFLKLNIRTYVSKHKKCKCIARFLWNIVHIFRN